MGVENTSIRKLTSWLFLENNKYMEHRLGKINIYTFEKLDLLFKHDNKFPKFEDK